VRSAPYYASGSDATTTGSISSGSTSLRVASGSTFSVNQGIHIAGAGASGADYVGTVNAVGGNNINISPAASTTVSGAVVRHDDTDAINNAIAAAFKAGGGKVYFPLGYYRVNKPLHPLTNSVIYPPQNPYTVGVQTIPISLVGEVAPAWMDINAGPASGVVIQSDVAGKGRFPAIYSAKAWKPVSPTNQEQEWNYVQTNFENLIFRTYNGTSLGGVNLMKAPRAIARNIHVDVGVTETRYPTTVVREPSAEVVGFAFPQVASGLSSADNMHVIGYYYGFYGSDHFRASNFVIATRCTYGYWFDFAAGTVVGALYTYHSLHALKVTGNQGRFDLTIHTEQVTTGSAWNKVTRGKTVDWEDAGDVAFGQIRFIFTNTSGETHYAPTLTGMSKVQKVALARPAQALSYANTGRLNVPSNTFVDIPWNVETHGGALVRHSTTTNSEQVVIDLAGWYEIRAVGHFVTVAGSADNGTGQRQIAITLDSVVYDADPRQAITGLGTVCRAQLTKYLTKGTIVRAQAWQNSGGALELLGGVNYSPVLTLRMIP
jgi:hypothetical protein